MHRRFAQARPESPSSNSSPAADGDRPLPIVLGQPHVAARPRRMRCDRDDALRRPVAPSHRVERDAVLHARSRGRLAGATARAASSRLARGGVRSRRRAGRRSHLPLAAGRLGAHEGASGHRAASQDFPAAAPGPGRFGARTHSGCRTRGGLRGRRSGGACDQDPGRDARRDRAALACVGHALDGRARRNRYPRTRCDRVVPDNLSLVPKTTRSSGSSSRKWKTATASASRYKS